MAQTAMPRTISERGSDAPSIPARSEAFSSGVSWPAVIGGAFVTAALGLILLTLGTGLGFSSVSPWSNAGASASTITTAAIVWLIFTQIIASTMGGYLQADYGQNGLRSIRMKSISAIRRMDFWSGRSDW
jgi:hypothetical protein